MHLGRLFQRSVQAYAGRPALARGTAESLDYAAIDQQVRALAGWMRHELKLKPGDRVTLAMKNSTSYAHALLATWYAELCAVPINNKLHPQEILYILQDSESKLCLTDRSLYDDLVPLTSAIDDLELINVEAGHFERALLTPSPDSFCTTDTGGNAPAWLFYTSGTTGRPKGVVLSHSNLINMALNFYADVQHMDDTDILLHAAPMSHGSGLYSIPAVLKGALQLVPESGGFDEAETCELLQHYRNVSLFAAPTMINRLVKHVADRGIALPGLKCIIVAGAPFYVEDIKRAVRVLGPRIAQIYGQGESPMSITAQSARQTADAVAADDDQFLSSVGYPQTSVVVSIEDPTGHALETGAPGEIMVAGPTVMQGYWKKPDASEQTLADGKLHTGDIGFIDGRGLLHLKDRSKEVIISGGSNIYPREVEEALIQHPDIAEVAVIGMPDADWGESVVAFVVCRDGSREVSREALDAHCLSRIARFKRPKHYVFVEQLPKNATGKVLKRQLRELAPARL